MWFAAVVAVLTLAGMGVMGLYSPAAQASGGGYVKKCSGGKIKVNEQEKTIFAAHNRIRKNHNLKPFCAQPALMKASRFHSDEELKHDYSDHRSFNGNRFYESSGKRIQRMGYTSRGFSYYIAGENIAIWSNPKTANKKVMDFWMHSSGHRANILNGKFHQIGVGVTRGNYKGSSGYTTFTVDFGRRK